MAAAKDDNEANAALSERLLSQENEADVEHQSVVMDEAVHSATTGERQPKAFRDAWAALLFLSHQVAIVYLAIAWGIPSLNYEYDSYNTTDEVHFGGLFYLCLTVSVGALLLSTAILTAMVHVAEYLVQMSLFFSLICNALIIVFFGLEQYWWGMVMGLVMLLWGAWYTYAVWRRIPFAASNLKTAVTAVQGNGGLFVAAFGTTVLINLWSILWMLALLGVYVRSAECSAGECSNHMNGFVVLLFLLSYYWTSEVCKNFIHVTVSGVVGTFVFCPDEASTFCSPAIHDSMVRAGTFSLGSICLGSLLTAVLQVLYHLTREARRQGRGNAMLLCVLECIVGCLERVVAYFNKWAYIYVGLYGYDYLTAGKKVMSLFMERGWTTIINDDLVHRALSLVSLVIGLLTGCLGLIMASVKPGWVEEFGSSASATAFFLPFFIGTAMAYILMSVVASAVDTVVVTFAEAPLEMERNHPGLYTQMATAWRQVYPDEYQS